MPSVVFRINSALSATHLSTVFVGRTVARKMAASLLCFSFYSYSVAAQSELGSA